MKSQIVLRRFEYEEPHHLHLELNATNGSFLANTDFYCKPSDLTEIGKALKNFPSKIGDEYVNLRFRRSFGSALSVFCIRAYTVGPTGNCAIQFKVNLNSVEPNDGVASFSIKADPAAINRLGDSSFDPV